MVVGMAKQNPRKLPSEASADVLAARAEEALRLCSFKEAIELYKQLLKQEARPEWRDALAAGYVGRAKALSAKGLFKEAEVVLGNAVALDGAVREPLFLLSCLIRQGQIQKALAQALKYIGIDALAPGQGRLLSDLTAALYLARPVPLAAGDGDPPARVEWIAAANAALEALAALTAQKPADEIELLLANIPARSPFGPVRLIVKSLLTEDPAKARRLLDGMPPDSAFGPLRLAAEAALPGEPAEVVGRLSGVSAAQRAFALDRLGGAASGSPMLARLLDAERGGPGTLFTFLSKQATSLPAADVRNACFNLLPEVPDRIALFEKTFGKLREADKARIFALAAEAKQDWARAETQWRAAAAQFADDGSREGKLSAGIIYRHLATLSVKEPEIAGVDIFSDPVVSYLRKSLDCDPDHLPAVLQLIKLYREDSNDKDWHALADEAAQRFPTDSAVLMQAIESAAARKAYKRAAGFAKKLLAVDPINRPARQRMIELQISHARKQMRSKRPDLASKELAAASEWERADTPDADLRINQGLVGLRGGMDLQAAARLREGVDLAGGGAVGWFRAALQDALMTPPRQRPPALIGEELSRALRGVPSKLDIVTTAALLSAEAVRADPKATHELGWKFCMWLRNATHTVLSVAEFHSVADAIVRAQLFDVLREFTVAGKRREPNERLWRFYEIVARTTNNPDRMYVAEEDEIRAMCNSPAIHKDPHGSGRIDRYLDSSGDDPSAKRRARRREASLATGDLELLETILAGFLSSISQRDVQRLVKSHGRDGAVTALADRLAQLPLGASAPCPLLKMVAGAIVATALGEAPPQFRTSPYGGTR
jgi:cellulose synthase operon protein C